jgi:hypothetical protein
LHNPPVSQYCRPEPQAKNLPFLFVPSKRKRNQGPSVHGEDAAPSATMVGALGWLCKGLLCKWEKENEGKEEKKSFVLPGIHCGKISLSWYVFSHTLDLTDATFTGGARFDNAEFTGDAGFHNAKFTKAPWFSNAKFKEELDFTDADFMLGCELKDLNIPRLDPSKIKTGYPFNITNCGIQKLEYTFHIGEKICFNKVKTGLEENAASGALTSLPMRLAPGSLF